MLVGSGSRWDLGRRVVVMLSIRTPVQIFPGAPLALLRLVLGVCLKAEAYPFPALPLRSNRLSYGVAPRRQFLQHGVDVGRDGGHRTLLNGGGAIAFDGRDGGPDQKDW